jgi:hypothetical protein
MPGLGTSSILAGAIMAVLWTCSGRKFDVDTLNHAVSGVLTRHLESEDFNSNLGFMTIRVSCVIIALLLSKEKSIGLEAA